MQTEKTVPELESSLAVFLRLIAEAYEQELQSLHPLPPVRARISYRCAIT